MRRCLVGVIMLLSACASNASAPSPSPCVVPRLVPSYLPHGVQRTQVHAFVPSVRTETWRDATRTVQVAEGVNANLGDGPDIKQITVQGLAAVYGPTGNPEGPLAVEWTDPSACSEAQYAVVVRGLPASEMLKIANGLRPA